ncbi:helix-turn-helix transcriptional regulator [Candidatus Binatia bacterium]|nr:helix-turn-helix transcriptional regulator [Candidatus Binatia bacterium]
MKRYTQKSWALVERRFATTLRCFPMLSRRISMARAALNLSCVRFAEAVRLDVVVLRAIEAGRASPTRDTLADISAFTGRPLGWFGGRG